MTAEERAHVMVTARVLRSASRLQILAIGFTFVGALAFLRDQGVAAALATIVLGAAGIYFGFRVTLDARLFEDMVEERLTTSELDAALGTLRGKKGSRGWLDRCRGARRLVAGLYAAVILQLVAILLIRWT